MGCSLLGTLVFVSVYVHMKPGRPDTHQYRGASGEKARWVRGMSIAMTTQYMLSSRDLAFTFSSEKLVGNALLYQAFLMI